MKEPMVFDCYVMTPNGIIIVEVTSSAVLEELSMSIVEKLGGEACKFCDERCEGKMPDDITSCANNIIYSFVNRAGLKEYEELQIQKKNRVKIEQPKGD